MTGSQGTAGLCRIASNGPKPGKNPNRSDLSPAPNDSRTGAETNRSLATAIVSERFISPSSVSDGVMLVDPIRVCWYDSDVDGFDIEADATTLGAFVQNRFAVMDRLFVTLAARLDHHSDFGSHPTFSAGIAYVHRETDTRLKASVGTAYKAPTLDQLYGAIPAFGFLGNPDLDPE